MLTITDRELKQIKRLHKAESAAEKQDREAAENHHVITTFDPRIHTRWGILLSRQLSIDIGLTEPETRVIVARLQSIGALVIPPPPTREAYIASLTATQRLAYEGVTPIDREVIHAELVYRATHHRYSARGVGFPKCDRQHRDKTIGCAIAAGLIPNNGLPLAEIEPEAGEEDAFKAGREKVRNEDGFRMRAREVDAVNAMAFVQKARFHRPRSKQIGRI